MTTEQIVAMCFPVFAGCTVVLTGLLVVWATKPKPKKDDGLVALKAFADDLLIQTRALLEVVKTRTVTDGLKIKTLESQVIDLKFRLTDAIISAIENKRNKVTVDISDEQVVESIRGAIDNCLSSSIPKQVPMKQYEAKNLSGGLEFCRAANRVIEWYGGCPVDLVTILEGE